MTSAGSPHTHRMVEAAAERGVEVEVTRFPAGTRTAADAERAGDGAG